MKLAIFACLLAVALARPQDFSNVATLRSENVNEGDGYFKYGFETDHGVSIDAEGTPGSEGQSNIVGSAAYPLGDGSTMHISYEADELGYRPVVTLTRN